MRKFRLIQTYPGGPSKLGFIVNFKPGFDHVSPSTFEAGRMCNISLADCIKFNENWQEITPVADYEILSIKSPNHDRLYVKHENGNFAFEEDDATSSLDHAMSAGWSIHSVKRLYDGAIFTIGDAISKARPILDTYGIITEFKIVNGKSSSGHSGRINSILSDNDNKIVVTFDNYDIATKLLHELDSTPLVITEDGAELTIGDHFVSVNVGEKSGETPFTIRAHGCTIHDESKRGQSKAKANDVLWFSTVDAALAYIKSNAPAATYQILSFSATIDDEVLYRNLDSNGMYALDGISTDRSRPLDEVYLLKEGSYRIHSIKRLSDGEIFTIGDSISYTMSSKTCKKKLKSIDKSTRNIMFVTSDGCRVPMSFIKHFIEPLVTSTDGVELYEGDDCYLVYMSHSESVKPDKTKMRKELLPNPSYRLIFSFEHNAINYAARHRRHLSVDDILRTFDHLSGATIGKLMELSKNKLKK